MKRRKLLKIVAGVTFIPVIGVSPLSSSIAQEDKRPDDKLIELILNAAKEMDSAIVKSTYACNANIGEIVLINDSTAKKIWKVKRKEAGWEYL